MWLLCRLDRTYRENHISLLRPGIEYIVGRKGKHEAQNPTPNKLTFTDKSVSRNHALLIVSGHSQDDLYKVEKRPRVILKDTLATYGTIAGNHKVERNGVVTLADHELLKFGNLFGLARVRWEPIVVYVVPGFGIDERRITQLACRLGFHLSKQWTDECTHLCTETLAPTEVLAKCLLQNKRVISSEWLQQLDPENDDNFKWPEGPCLPEETVDSNLIKPYECTSNRERRTLFADLHFLIFDENQYNLLEDLIPGAHGGMKYMPLKSRRWSKDLVATNTIVVVPEEFGNDEEAWNDIVQTLVRSNLRPVAMWEIYCAVIKCSTEDFCNPRKPLPSDDRSVPPTASSNFSRVPREAAPDSVLPELRTADLLGEREPERSPQVKLEEPLEEPEAGFVLPSFLVPESDAGVSSELQSAGTSSLMRQEASGEASEASARRTTLQEPSASELENTNQPPQSLGNILDDIFGFGDNGDNNDAHHLTPLSSPPVSSPSSPQRDSIYLEDESQDIPFAVDNVTRALQARRPSQPSVQSSSIAPEPSSPPLFLPQEPSRLSPLENVPESSSSTGASSRRSTRRRNRATEVSQDITHRELRSTRRTDQRHREEESAVPPIPEEENEENAGRPNSATTTARQQDDDASDIESPVEEDAEEDEEEEENLEIIPGKRYTHIDQVDDLVVATPRTQPSSRSRSREESISGPNFKRFKKVHSVQLEHILQYVEMQ